MSNVNPIFDRLFSDMADAGLLPKAIATDIPRPADPLPGLDDIEEGVTTCTEGSDHE